MRIFKNRGDIYFSKVNKEKSKEQKILIIALTVIIIFTVLFVSLLCITNDFSAKKFFAPENINISDNTVIYDDEMIELPEVSGKTNYAVLIYDNETLLFVSLIQSDMDNKAFKASVLKGNTEIEGKAINDIFKSSGSENVMNAIQTELKTSFDYYIAMKSSDYQDFFNRLGSINYPILNDIKYRDNKSSVSYSLKIKSGEQKIDGRHFVNLIRYYIDVENNFSQANEIMLAALAQQLNEKNMADSDSLFKSLVTIADTNLTVRDFSLATDKLTVITNEQAAKGIYNAPAQYEGNKISDDGLKKMKGYFVK